MPFVCVLSSKVLYTHLIDELLGGGVADYLLYLLGYNTDPSGNNKKPIT